MQLHRYTDSLSEQQLSTHMSGFTSQRGVILIVALVMLLVMTTLGVTTMTGATLQERIAGNNRQQFVARTNADAALRAGENYLSGLSTGTALRNFEFSSVFLTTNGLYSPKPVVNGAVTQTVGFDVTAAEAWTAANSIGVEDVADRATWLSRVGLTEKGIGANLPRYIIEYMGQYDEEGLHRVTDLSGTTPVLAYVFRITAIGWGKDSKAVSVLQSHYLSSL